VAVPVVGSEVDEEKQMMVHTTIKTLSICSHSFFPVNCL
jgi:hypothetical protein